MPDGRAFVSAFIVLGLGLQALTAFGFKFKRLWPFICYPMYSAPREKNQAVPRYTLIGVTADRKEVELGAGDFMLDEDHFFRGPVDAFRFRRFEILKRYLDLHTRRTGRRYTAVRLVNRPVTIDGGRMVERPAAVISEYSPGEGR